MESLIHNTAEFLKGGKYSQVTQEEKKNMNHIPTTSILLLAKNITVFPKQTNTMSCSVIAVHILDILLNLVVNDGMFDHLRLKFDSKVVCFLIIAYKFFLTC
jgi:hypothetical protein